MNEDALNMSIRKFLKTVGITSQREIERALAAAVEAGRLKGTETLPVKATVTLAGADLEIVIDGDIALE